MEVYLIPIASDRLTPSAGIALTLLGLACILPFLSPAFHAPIATFYGEALAFALGLAAIALMMIKSLWAGIRMPRVGLMFIGFAFLMVLQIFLGKAIYAQLNLLGALYVLWAAALAMLANRLVRAFGATRFVSILSWFLIAGTVLSSCIGLMQWLGVQTPLAPFMLPQIHGRIYANTGQPNHLASYLCLGLASVGYLWSGRRLGSVPAILICCLLCAVLAISGSRAVWIYLLAFNAFAALMAIARPSAELKRLLGFSVAIVAGLVIAQWMLAEMAQLVPQRAVAVETIGSRVQIQGLSSPVRMQFWNEAWLMFRGAPAFGVGFKQFAWNYFLRAGQFPAEFLDEGIIDHAHNLIFHVAAEFGVAGLILLLGGVGWWGWSMRHAHIDAPLWWMAATLGVIGMHSMLEYPLWYAYFLGFVAVIMGAAECNAPAADKGSSGRAVLWAAVLLGAFAFVNIYQDYRVMQSLQGTAYRQTTGATVSGEQSTRMLLDMQRTSLFSPYVEFALARRMLLNRDHLRDKIVLNERAMRFQPANDFAYRQALLLAMSGDVPGMQAQWNLAVANYPKDRAQALQVAQTLDQSGEAGMQELLNYAKRQDGKAQQ